MKTPRKAIVSKRISEDEKLNSIRWTQFIIHSGVRFEDLSDEWVEFFDSQAEISTAQTELVRLIDLAIEADKVKEIK